MKKLTLLLAAFAAVTITASAQRAGLTWMLSPGNTNIVAPLSTNVFVAMAPQPVPGGLQTANTTLRCDEFDAIGVTILATPSATSTGTVTFKFVKSFDGGTVFEDWPSVAITLTFNGTGQASARAVVDMTGATHLALVAIEDPTSVSITAPTIEANLKSPKRGALTSTQ